MKQITEKQAREWICEVVPWDANEGARTIKDFIKYGIRKGYIKPDKKRGEK